MLKHINPKHVDTKLISPPAHVCLKCVGGVGDALIIVGGGGKKLQELGYTVTASVMEHQKELVLNLEGITGYVKPQRLHLPEERNKFDCVIDFTSVFNNSHDLKRGDYYELASDRLGVNFGPGKFKPFAMCGDVQTIALHPGASHPNRRWSNYRWTELAYKLSASGNYVLWLGTKDEFGFNDYASKIIKLSDDSEDLLYQASHLERCRYFVGNDSGFAHIAGLLEVPGLVLFFATHPDDVIKRYPSLTGVHNFSSYDEPSRSLRIQNTRDEEFKELLSVKQVIDASIYDDVETFFDEREPKEAIKTKLNVTYTNGIIEDIDNFLKSNYELDTEGLVLIVNKDRSCELKTLDRSAHMIINHVEELRRAIREFQNS